MADKTSGTQYSAPVDVRGASDNHVAIGTRLADAAPSVGGAPPYPWLYTARVQRHTINTSPARTARNRLKTNLARTADEMRPHPTPC